MKYSEMERIKNSKFKLKTKKLGNIIEKIVSQVYKEFDMRLTDDIFYLDKVYSNHTLSSIYSGGVNHFNTKVEFEIFDDEINAFNSALKKRLKQKFNFGYWDVYSIQTVFTNTERLITGKEKESCIVNSIKVSMRIHTKKLNFISFLKNLFSYVF